MKLRFTAAFIAIMLLLSVFSSAFAATIKLAYSGGSLKLRGGPGTSYSVKAYLKNGQSVSVLKTGSVWSKIKLSNGTTGYVKNLYIKGNGSKYASGTTYYNNKYTAYVKTKYSGSSVNLRAGASASTSSMGALKNGTKVTVLGKNGSWYLVSTSKGKQGYIKTSYISKTKSSASTSSAKVTASVVHMRSAANSGSKIVTSLSKGTKVTVVSTSNSKWWKVKYGTKTGYIYSKYLKK